MLASGLMPRSPVWLRKFHPQYPVLKVPDLGIPPSGGPPRNGFPRSAQVGILRTRGGRVKDESSIRGIFSGMGGRRGGRRGRLPSSAHGYRNALWIPSCEDGSTWLF